MKERLQYQPSYYKHTCKCEYDELHDNLCVHALNERHSLLFFHLYYYNFVVAFFLETTGKLSVLLFFSVNLILFIFIIKNSDSESKLLKITNIETMRNEEIARLRGGESEIERIKIYGMCVRFIRTMNTPYFFFYSCVFVFWFSYLHLYIYISRSNKLHLYWSR